MTHALLVPMHLDVLRLEQPSSTCGPMLNVEALPWASKDWERDVNADTPFMGSAIEAAPFGGRTRTLARGFHLHWALPDALCRGRLDTNTGKMVFPPVPTRWLVSRTIGGVVSRWVIESDYIWPPRSKWPKDDKFPDYQRDLAVSLLAHDVDDHAQPFQEVGRAFAWHSWREDDRACRMESRAADGSRALLAVGYGDATFAAYHPHSHSVFGFSDRWDDAELPEEVEYQVVGWYADLKQDPVVSPTEPWQKETLDRETIGSLPSHRWKVTAEQPPRRTLCFAATRVAAASVERPEQPVVAVAETATHALSALIASELVDDDDDVRARVEDQLMALHVRTRLGTKDFDLAARLRIATHEQGFTPLSGASRWRLGEVEALDGDGDATRLPSPLPPALTAGLRALNKLEDQLHQKRLDHTTARRALYADWCQYMTIAYREPDDDPHLYPEIDTVRDYIERVHLRSHEEGGVPVVEALAVELVALEDAIVAKKDLIAGEKGLIATEALPLTLDEGPGPRFWQPNDPVVLLTGGGLRRSRRHRQDGRGQGDGHLECGWHEFKVDPWPLAKPDFLSVLGKLTVPEKNDDLRCTGFATTEGRPFNPMFLEWGIDLYPAEGQPRERSAGQGRYDEDVIVQNYDIPSRASDLRPLTDLRTLKGLDIAANPDRFQGRCGFSSHTGRVLLDRISAFLCEELFEDYGPLTDAPDKDHRNRLEEWHAKGFGTTFYPVDTRHDTGHRFDPTCHGDLEEWYLERPTPTSTLDDCDDTDRFWDPLWTAICALKWLYNGGHQPRDILSAALDGFNEELLGFYRGAVLPIDEPIGFSDYRDFSRRVAAQVGLGVATPAPHNPFSPIRSGELELSALRVIDSFGQSRLVKPGPVVGPTRYTSHGRRGVIYLPPRVIQPLNAKFRWLEAETTSDEMDDAPDSEVICGWLVPNANRRTINVFSRKGRALGLLAIDREHGYVEWVPAPGQPAIEKQQDLDSRGRDVLQMDAAIDNAHLRKVVYHIWKAPTAYLEAFVDSLTDALENIDPEAGAEYNSMAMLLGRPLAVARAELDLVPLTEAVTRSDWLAFERRIRGEPQSDEGYARVQFPMRLGEYGQLDDGLAGYWIDDSSDDEHFADRCFYAQSADDVAALGDGTFAEYKIVAHMKTTDDGSSIRRFAGQTINIRQTIADPALQLTVLFDPRGVVHLTTGILPTKVIRVPPQRYAEAIEAIELWFQAGPLLTRRGVHELPLPTDPTYDVVWRESARRMSADLDDEQLVWDDLRAAPSIDRVTLEALLDGFQSIDGIQDLVDADWIKEADRNGQRYRILPPDKRKSLDNAEALSVKLEQASSRLAEPQFVPGDDRPNEAREGWLVFQPRQLD